MKKIYNLLLVVAAPLLIMGAGCGATKTAVQTSPGGNGTSVVTVSSTYDGTDDGVLLDVEPGATVIKTATGTSVSATLGYMNALKSFGVSGARIQFANCSGNPGTLNIKLGIKFMIDNRDGDAHIIGIGARTYNIPAYGYAIVSVPKSGSYNITCDGGGAAHVGVEK